MKKESSTAPQKPSFFQAHALAIDHFVSKHAYRKLVLLGMLVLGLTLGLAAIGNIVWMILAICKVIPTHPLTWILGSIVLIVSPLVIFTAYHLCENTNDHLWNRLSEIFDEWFD